MRKKMWDIFCKVVDNFGDIGVSWRLARQLVAEHGLSVRLWVDDLESFQRLCPEIDPSLEIQTQRGVQVRHWTSPFPETDAADVVIEAFACELPESYLAAMAGRDTRPAWINLEYLSAEAWVTDCHGLPSPHPRLPLTKHFFFPGFVAGSGGLLREAGLLQRRDAWRSKEPWAELGLPQPEPDETSVSLFCYENPALPELLQLWAEGETAMRCLVPEGRPLAQAAAWLGQSLKSGESLRKGNLTLYAVPFTSQEDYDPLLWACDLNFVRGEDSFVRAQWAAKPLVWHIYPQEEEVHLFKLDAFLRGYCADLSPPAAEACRGFWQSWNGEGNLTAAWPAYWNARTELEAHAASWAGELEKREDLASNLVIFCEKLI